MSESKLKWVCLAQHAGSVRSGRYQAGSPRNKLAKFQSKRAKPHQEVKRFPQQK